MTKFSSSFMSSMVVILALGLASCGQKSVNTEPTKTVETATEHNPSVEETVIETAQSAEELGAKIYARCRTCHTLDENGKNRVGPNLWNIFGAKAGSSDGFAYSKAMTASAIIWDDASMGSYIANPKEFMPGNKMVFIGIKKPEDRENLIAYLKANTGAE